MTHSRGSIFGLVAMLLVVSAATQWWAGRSQAQLGFDGQRVLGTLSRAAKPS